MNTKTNSVSRIGGYLILPGGGEWQNFLDLGDEDGGMSCLSGCVHVDSELDVTWLSSWQVLDSTTERFKTIKDVEAELATMPAWDGTRWACAWDDFGRGNLIDCKTGKVDKESPEAKAAIKRINASLKNRNQ